ncbi:DUF938 domain-containing protein [Pseudacidovorax sp. RU35E]|uniref:DUF938 domain-containing protein n=1 Tax=Pseudacidovorax sp. RU35E TaxID=1907403 RepID=UPI000956EAF1|nr:DUF938 domain-containing protein [Pseudacidovorax sp. RU35E]SIR73385.1 Protein of unknown function [Pseudacidovorax sp. RU35E]
MPGLITSPAAERNKGPILAELLRLLPVRGHMLEVAAGTGQHAAHFAAALPDWRWLPTEPDAALLPAIAVRTANMPQVLAPVALDVREAWPVAPASLDAVYCANMIHISPWDCTAGLMRGAGRALQPGGLLVLYGPYVVDGEPLAPSNAAFDADLRRRDPAWGLRDLAAVQAEAAKAGLAGVERVSMPANNLLVVFRRER